MGECMEGAGNLGEVADEPSVEVHEPYEGLRLVNQFLVVLLDRPIVAMLGV